MVTPKATARIGRPRQYESDAEKVGAFRIRQESAGYLRREVLVTRDTSGQLTNLAGELGTSVLDVASGLLELGLTRYLELEASQQANARKFEGTASPVSAQVGAPHVLQQIAPASLTKMRGRRAKGKVQGAGLPARGEEEKNPIKRFFALRRESLGK